MSDTLYAVINVPQNVDQQELICFAEQIITPHIRTEIGQCRCFYTTEMGDGHLHLNILFQFDDIVDRLAVTYELQSITRLSDIKVVTVTNNVQNVIDYMRKEDDHLEGEADNMDIYITPEQIYDIQAKFASGGHEQSRKRGRDMADQDNEDHPAKKAKRTKELSVSAPSSADLLLRDVDRLLNKGLNSVDSIATHYWNMRSDENQSMFRMYTQHISKVKAHVTQVLKMTSRTEAKSNILALPFST